jgi:hypothetical protein
MGVEGVFISLILFMVVVGVWRMSRQRSIDERLEREKRLAELNRLDARDGRFQGPTGPLN